MCSNIKICVSYTRFTVSTIKMISRNNNIRVLSFEKYCLLGYNVEWSDRWSLKFSIERNASIFRVVLLSVCSLIFAWFTLQSSEWRQYVPPKRRKTYAELHGVIFKNVTCMRTSVTTYWILNVTTVQWIYKHVCLRRPRGFLALQVSYFFLKLA